ncbi:sigma factor [Rhodococcus qingshengii]|uniref:sigma factor n=1 Tax=Rhodococcus qingshengii TaxID=334542 RepID=UPI003BAE1687
MVKADPDDHLVPVLCSVSSGSRAAFAEFYDRTSPRVCGLLMQMLGDQQVSEELARSVYREVWACAPQYKTENGSPTAWVITIAHRRAIEKIRSRPRHEAVRPSQEASGSAEEAHARNDGLRWSTTECRARRYLYQGYYRGWSQRQIAHRDGVTVALVRSSIKSAVLTARASQQSGPMSPES